MLMTVAAPWRWMNIAPRAKAEKNKLGRSAGSLGWNSANNDFQIPSSGCFWVAFGSLLGHSWVSPFDLATTDGPPVFEALYGLVQLAGTPA